MPSMNKPITDTSKHQHNWLYTLAPDGEATGRYCTGCLDSEVIA